MSNTVAVNFNQYKGKVTRLLTQYPEYRNLDDTEFWLKYCDHYLGFRVGSIFTFEMKEDITRYANPQTIARVLRKLREPELKEIKQVLEELVKMQGNHELYDAHVKDLKQNLHKYQYLPYDVNVLIHKYAKEETIKELMLNAEKWL